MKPVPTYRLTNVLAGDTLIAEVEGFRSARRLIEQMAVKDPTRLGQLVRVTHMKHPEKSWIFSPETIPNDWP